MRNDTTTRMLVVRLRHAGKRDLADVADTEARSFPDPWDTDRLRLMASLPDVDVLVAEAGGVVVGHLIYRRDPDRLEVLRLAVDPLFRQHLVGSYLLTRAMADAERHPTGTVGLYVRERNLGAQLWLRKNGWRAVGVSRGHFSSEAGFDFEFRVERW